MAHITKSSYAQLKTKRVLGAIKSPVSHDYTDVNNGCVEESLFTFCQGFSLVSMGISHQIKHWTGEDTGLP